jgi:carboxymethylenebutenolidase
MQRRDLDLGTLVHPDASEGDASEGAHPGVVMIHDVWGLADHTRDLATRLAGEGFAVLALDLYRGLPDAKIEDPGRFIRELSDPSVLADVQTGIDFLASDPASAGRPVGVTGFCMGGMYALLAACTCSGLSAAVSFYGMLSYEHGMLRPPDGVDRSRKPRQPLDAAPELGCPLLAFFGEADRFIPLADVERLRGALSEAAHPSEVRTYPGAGHAFMNDTRPEAYHPEAAADAWRRSVAFLGARLG